MSDVTVSVEAVEDAQSVALSANLSANLPGDQLIGQLVDRACVGSLQLTGEGGLQQQRPAATVDKGEEHRTVLCMPVRCAQHRPCGLIGGQ